MSNTIWVLLTIMVEEAERKPLPWWLILPILLLIVVVVIWVLNRNARASEAPEVAHDDAAEHLAETDRGLAAPAPVQSDRATEPTAVQLEAAPLEVDRAIEPPAHIQSDRAIEPAIPPAPALPDDLAIVEGIGPKIAGLLNQAGITTFAQLASASVADLRALMDKAGLHIADPATWPEQAALAARGDLEELKALQDSLKGGRKTE